MTFEVFALFCAGLLIVCALYSWYMIDKLYNEAVTLHACSIELVHQVEKWLSTQNRRPKNESDNQRRPDSGQSS